MMTLLPALACGPAPSGSDSDPGSSSGGPDTSSGGPDTSGDEPTGSSGDPPTGTTGDDAWARICDGSQELRLAIVLGGGGNVANEIEREIGFYYLYVRGTCEYYVLPPESSEMRWPDAHTGVLDLATEEALSRAFDYGGLAELAGSYKTLGLSDGTTLQVSDGTNTVWCYGGCEEGPPAAQALWSTFHPWIDDLWAKGEPLLGALRVSVIGLPGEAVDAESALWPLMADPWSIAVDGSQSSEFPTVLIDAGDDLAILHAERKKYREGDLPPGEPNPLKLGGNLVYHDISGQDLFNLWIRDALPIEDEDGKIHLPPPPGI